MDVDKQFEKEGKAHTCYEDDEKRYKVFENLKKRPLNFRYSICKLEFSTSLKSREIITIPKLLATREVFESIEICNATPKLHPSISLNSRMQYVFIF